MIRRLLLASALLLAGCATPETRPVPADIHEAWKQHQQAMQLLKHWTLHGRIAVQYGSDGGQANLLWTHQVQQNDIRLVGPWGKGLIRLKFNPQSAELTDDAGQTSKDADAATLLYLATGWVVPVQLLDTWVLGLPVNPQSRIELDKYGRLKSLVEAGWKIEYPEYRQFENRELPRKLVLSQTGEARDNRQVSVRLVVSKWQVKH